MGPPVPDDPDQPPGARNLVRILAETLQAHGEALSAGENLSAALTPQQWFGPAREAFVDTGVPKIDTEWQQVKDINRVATEKVSGHSNFLHALRDLWASASNDPVERARLRVLQEQAAGKLAAQLMEWSGELDKLGYIDLSDPATSIAPDDVAEPAPKKTDAVAPENHAAASDDQPVQRAVATFARSARTVARLREQMLTGERRDHIPWTG